MCAASFSVSGRAHLTARWRALSLANILVMSLRLLLNTEPNDVQTMHWQRGIVKIQRNCGREIEMIYIEQATSSELYVEIAITAFDSMEK